MVSVCENGVPRATHQTTQLSDGVPEWGARLLARLADGNHRLHPRHGDAGGTGGGQAKAAGAAIQPAGRNGELVIPETPRRILIADDEHLIASGLAASVQSLGYQVIGPVSDGRAAIIAAEAELPDLCLMDIKMPEMDGLQAANEIWKQMGIPTILISAFSDQEYVNRAIETGVFGYLLKPVNADDLRVAIGVAWMRAKQQDMLLKRVDQLLLTIENRKTIEQAKWRIVEMNKLSEPEAHTALQRFARSTRQKLHDVATQLLEGKLAASEFDPKPPAKP
jgi:AmiR/NasT family two-component response regulator